MNRDAIQRIDNAKRSVLAYEPRLGEEIQSLDIREVEGTEGVIIELTPDDPTRSGYLVYDPTTLLQMEGAAITHAILEQGRRLWPPPPTSG